MKLWRLACERLRAEGAELVEGVSLPHSPFSLNCYHVLTSSDVQSNMARYSGLFFGHRAAETEQEKEKNGRTVEPESFQQLLVESRNAGFGPVVRRRIFAGNFYNLKE